MADRGCLDPARRRGHDHEDRDDRHSGDRSRGPRRHAAVLHVDVHVLVLPEQPVAAEGVQRVRAVRRLHRRRGARPERGVPDLLVESVHPVHHTRRVGRTGR